MHPRRLSGASKVKGEKYYDRNEEKLVKPDCGA